MNYQTEAINDAIDFANNYIDEIVEQLQNEGKASDDYNNDYPSGDSYFHGNYVDRSYNLKEAAELLDDLDDFEETDSGLWEGQELREAIATQAAFTYGCAVGSFFRDLIEKINDEASDNFGDDKELSEMEPKVIKGFVEEVIKEFAK